MQRKMTLIGLVAALLTLLAVPAAMAQDDDGETVVGIFQFVSHPALNASAQGAYDMLNAAGYVDGENTRYIMANGDGDIPTLSTIAEDFLDEGVDVIIAVSTPALQAAYSATSDLEGPPVIFNSVTSPYVAGVAQASCVHPSWVVGSQALAPFEDIMPLILEVLPEATTLGHIYNTAEANSVANLEIIEGIAEDLGLTLEIQTVANSSEVPTAAEALVSRGIDAFFIATDSTVVSGFEGLVAVANENGVPLIASDTASVPRGALLARGLDYYQDGLDAGSIAAAYLNGEIDIATTMIARQRQSSLAINLDAAEIQGATVPDSLLEQASVIIKGGESRTVEMDGAEMTAEDLEAMRLEHIATLECTQEMIDEQMAALEGDE